MLTDLGPNGAPIDASDLRPCPFCAAAMLRYSRTATFFHPGVITDTDCVLAGRGFYDAGAWNTRPAALDEQGARRILASVLKEERIRRSVMAGKPDVFIDYTTAIMAIQAAGGEEWGPGLVERVQDAALRSMNAGDVSQRALARALGVSEGRVSQALTTPEDAG